MEGNKNAKTKIWIYAVVLFSSAFIVLLITGYSQIKLNKNLSSYRNKISNTENERNKYQLNFSTAQETNNKLKEENDKLKSDNTTLKTKVDSLEKEKAQIADDNEKALQEYDKLCTAQANYLNENFVMAAGILIKQINYNLLDTKARELYSQLIDKVRPKAEKILYNDGYQLYENKDYVSAAEKFKFALDIAPAGAYTDGVIYFLALSTEKTGDLNSAAGYMQLLIQTYPESKYYEKAKYYYEKYSD